MKLKSRYIAALLAVTMSVSSLPARAESGVDSNILFGLLAAIGVSLGIVAYRTDYHKEPELKVHDETKDLKKKEGVRIEIVPPPASNDEARPADISAAVAFTAKF